MKQHKLFSKTNYLNISNKIPQHLVDLIRPVAKTLKRHKIASFIIGATARDIVFQYCYGVRAARLTKDVDWGLAISNWTDFTKIKKSLIATSLFSETTSPHRLLDSTGIPIDLVPFGLIAQHDNIAWPPDFSVQMTTLGYKEAYELALDVTISETPRLKIKFASPVGLALLKIIAWNDNPEIRRKDAEDLAYIVSEYLELDNRERLLLQHEDIITENDNYTYLQWSGRLLGRDIRKIVTEKTRKNVLTILENETTSDKTSRLASHMTSYANISYEEAQRILLEMLKGIAEGCCSSSSSRL